MGKRKKGLDAHAALIDDLVAANHILYDQGVVDGFGHISARDDRDPKRFLLSRSCAPSLVEADDILTYDLEGNALDGEGEKLYAERFIHAAIFAARPDVNAVVHSHSPAIIPFGITDVDLRPVYHMSGFLGEGVMRFDTRPIAGDTNLLVDDMRLGRALAQALGDKSVCLMRGHGSVAVGGYVRQAVYRAIYTEMNARLQSEAMRLSANVNYLSDGESQKTAGLNELFMERPWGLWTAEAERNRD
jgi:HCOMODA/2-hydroxy-3-carboxy-muconic semialdehyde decarboxylase